MHLQFPCLRISMVHNPYSSLNESLGSDVYYSKALSYLRCWSTGKLSLLMRKLGNHFMNSSKIFQLSTLRTRFLWKGRIMLQAQPNGLERVREWPKNPPSSLIMSRLTLQFNSFSSICGMFHLMNCTVNRILLEFCYIGNDSNEARDQKNIPIQSFSLPFSLSLIFSYSPLLFSFKFGYSVIFLVSVVSYVSKIFLVLEGTLAIIAY